MSQKNGQQHCQINGVMTNQEAKKEAAAVKEQAAQQEVTIWLGITAFLVLTWPMLVGQVVHSALSIHRVAHLANMLLMRYDLNFLKQEHKVMAFVWCMLASSGSACSKIAMLPVSNSAATSSEAKAFTKPSVRCLLLCYISCSLCLAAQQQQQSK